MRKLVLSLVAAGGALAAAVSGSGATYTISVTGMTSPGDVVVSVPAGAAVDLVGNPSLAATGGDTAVSFTGAQLLFSTRS